MIEAELTADEARRLQLRAQGFIGARPKGGVPAMLERLGAVQLDTISVLARSHELVPYARLGSVGRASIEAAYWGNGTAHGNSTGAVPGRANAVELGHTAEQGTGLGGSVGEVSEAAEADDHAADREAGDSESVGDSGGDTGPHGDVGAGSHAGAGRQGVVGAAVAGRDGTSGVVGQGSVNDGVVGRGGASGVGGQGGVDDGVVSRGETRGVGGTDVEGLGGDAGPSSAGGAGGSGGGDAGRARRGSGRAPRGGAGSVGARESGGFGAFEYWAHAASLIPLGDWPLFAFRRRAYLRRGWRWHKVPEGVCDEIRARLRSDGPLTTKELGGAKASAEWWDWSDHKIGIEWLLDIGEVVCVQRVGWRRVYDLAERAVPAELLAQEPDDDACLTALVARAGRALGVATRGDLADYYRLKQDQVERVVEATGLVPVKVAGWTQRAWADPDALAELSGLRGRHATTLLSPFDSLVWDRARASRVFGFDHRLEAYVPKAKRVHGYFAMPLLAGGRLLGRVDPAREGRTLIARQVSMEARAMSTPSRTESSATALATALWRAASWVGCDDVRVERSDLPRDVIEPALKNATPS